MRTRHREYKTVKSFLKAHAHYSTSGELVHWYGTDHSWTIILRPVFSAFIESEVQ